MDQLWGDEEKGRIITTFVL
jgi:hypothetical protein